MGCRREISKQDRIDELTYQHIICFGLDVATNAKLSFTELSDMLRISVKELTRLANFLNIFVDSEGRWYFYPTEKGEKPTLCYKQERMMLWVFQFMEAGYVWDRNLQTPSVLRKKDIPMGLYPRFNIAIDRVDSEEREREEEKKKLVKVKSSK